MARRSYSREFSFVARPSDSESVTRSLSSWSAMKISCALGSQPPRPNQAPDNSVHLPGMHGVGVAQRTQTQRANQSAIIPDTLKRSTFSNSAVECQIRAAPTARGNRGAASTRSFVGAEGHGARGRRRRGARGRRCPARPPRLATRRASRPARAAGQERAGRSSSARPAAVGQLEDDAPRRAAPEQPRAPTPAQLPRQVAGRAQHRRADRRRARRAGALARAPPASCGRSGETAG